MSLANYFQQLTITYTAQMQARCRTWRTPAAYCKVPTVSRIHRQL